MDNNEILIYRVDLLEKRFEELEDITSSLQKTIETIEIRQRKDDYRR